LQAFKTNVFGEDARLFYEANSTHGYLYVDFGDLRRKVSLTPCTVSHATRGPPGPSLLQKQPVFSNRILQL
jgi:hypothetical protein